MEARGRIPVGPPVNNPTPSYWHAPKSALANVTLPENKANSLVYDHVIIGSGISGTAIAFYLLKAKPSARILMLEAREACGGATGRNGGHTKAASYRTYLQHRDELGREEALKIARLEYANIVETHRLAKELGIECESQLCNTVDIVYDQETFTDGCAAIEAIKDDAKIEEQQKGGMADYKVYQRGDELCRTFWVDSKNSNSEVKEEEIVAGAFEYLAGRVSAYRFSTGLLEKCVEKGLHFRTNSPVHKFLPVAEKNNFRKPLYDVFTQYETIRTYFVIIATNGYTPYLLPSLQGVIVPLRGQITAQKPGNSTKLPKVLPTTYSFIYKSGYEYMIPRTLPSGGQHIVIGGGLGRQLDGGASEFGTVDDSSLNQQISKYLHGSLVGYFGEKNWGEDGAQEGRVVHEWTGIMGATADGQPLVGKIPGEPGVWMSAGFNGHGMVLCLKSAEAVAKMIVSGNQPEEIDWFPKSFLVSQERLDRCVFQGRKDMKVPESGETSIAKAKI
ncbi:FAD dependent oxidoreductase-like protein [Corynespora cassiicola Philippines]|uniref:FAD dependent oxidoreductase-like protein n=1 Tax=Corynespora cassiicola Philippines TaxID=1448308 RepID=A0A2T2N8B5_CORCC|nr:FAD dependent oxidoreductase-like protein [Corynespora cassiicola Philippines]